MAKHENQKVKIISLIRLLYEKTDDKHGLTMQEILKSLADDGISAERKSIYSDIEALREYGFDIISENRGGKYIYYIGSRQFELAELKLLVDSVQSSRFITEKKSNELIRKIESFASKYEAGTLQRQVYVRGRVKAMNESIFYNVDRVHEAISADRKIRFQYFSWTVDKTAELRKNGEKYTVSPWGLSWDDENYYMIAYDSAESKIKHFRVDKMLRIEIGDEKREGADRFRSLNMADYSRKTFGMFGGEEELVRIDCDNRFAGVMIDRFGKEAAFQKIDEGHFFINVRVAVSPAFFGWIVSLGDGVRIAGPARVVDRMKEEAERLIRQYGGE